MIIALPGAAADSAFQPCQEEAWLSVRCSPVSSTRWPAIWPGLVQAAESGGANVPLEVRSAICSACAVCKQPHSKCTCWHCLAQRCTCLQGAACHSCRRPPGCRSSAETHACRKLPLENYNRCCSLDVSICACAADAWGSDEHIERAPVGRCIHGPWPKDSDRLQQMRSHICSTYFLTQ